MIDTVSAYIINPCDTLYFAMKINNWGKLGIPFKEIREKTFFSNSGYFPKGKYSLYYIKPVLFRINMISELKPVYRSGIFKLNVIENNYEDKFILNFIKQNETKLTLAEVYKSLMDKYPGNTYSEHIFAAYISSKHSVNNESETLLNDYEEFIAQYPDSPYLLDESFINNYFSYLCLNFIQYEEAVDYLKKYIKNQKLLKFISNEKRLYNIVIHKWNL